MLLVTAGVDRQEKMMVQASISNGRSFDRIADALICQHPRIHLSELRRITFSVPKGKDSFGQKGSTSRTHNRTGFCSIAYFGENGGSDEDEYPCADPAGDRSECDGDCYSGDAVGVDEVEDPLGAAELDASGFLASAYGDPLPDDDDAVADYVQVNSVAFAALKGKGKRGKGMYPVRPSTAKETRRVEETS